MGVRAGSRFDVMASLAAAAFALAMTGGLSPAYAGDFIAPNNNPPTVNDGWQAGTCRSDAPTQCSVDTPRQFFTQAAGHPNVGFTQFIVQTNGLGMPIENIKDVRVDIPAGLSVNPASVPQCPVEQFEANTASCAGSELGKSLVTVQLLPAPAPPQTLEFTVYNLEPPEGVPLLNGFNPGLSPELTGIEPVYIVGGVAWDSDYHEFFTISDISAALPLVKNRLVYDGQAGTGGGGAFLTTPSTCYDPSVPGFENVYSTFLRADSHQSPDPNFPANPPSTRESPLPSGVMPTGCDLIPFDPSIDVTPGTAQTDSPAGASFDLQVPFDPRASIANSNVQDTRVTLPEGMGLNPAAANGLVACTDEQFGKGTKDPVACPAASRVGAVEVHTPALPSTGGEPQLTGDVFVGQPLSNDPVSGNQFRIFVVAESTRYGLLVRLIGNVSANPSTGRLTTVFSDLPQVPFDSFKLILDGGPKATLSSPSICGPHEITTALTPYSGTSDATPSSSFTLTNAPGGGDCAKTLAERPFDPSFDAKTTNPKAGAYSPLHVDIARSDGNQELKGVNVDIPPGHTAKLAGVRYCPEAAIAAAAASSGLTERAQPSCPDSSLVGSVSATTGTGSEPLSIEGKAYLAGPFNGAPFSLAVVTPATAGPFDLGSVVVRVALFVDPRTAQIHAVSDPIPHVFGGVLLGIRTIMVRIDRRQFSLNPTNCSPMSAVGTLRGGGGNPNDPAAFTSKSISTPFQVSGCENLDFKPKLHMRLFGAMRRAKNPKLRAVLVAREGDANVGRAAVTLPRTLFLDQASLAKVCTRPQYAADACPKESIYGFARAFTPLLDGPLQGPVYLRSSDNLLPDLVASLRGQVNVELAGRIDSVKGRIRNTFDVIPDVPVSKFLLTIRGGKQGLLVNSRNQCDRQTRVIARLKGQNGKQANQRPKLRTPCKKSVRKHKRRGGRR